MKSYILIILFLFASMCLCAQGMRNIGANIVIESGAHMYIDGNANGKYTNETTGVNHGEIDLDGFMYVEGDWTNNANSGNVFINNTTPIWGTLELNGTGAQSIGGSRSTHFEDIYLKNSTKTLMVDSIEVNDRLRLQAADLNLNQNVLIIDNNSTSGLSATAGNGIISESNAANYGILHWNIGSTTTADFIIPFIDGVGGSEIPFTFRPNSGITGSIRVATYNTPAANTPLPAIVNHLQDATTGADNSAIAVDRFFMIDVSGSGVNADVTFAATAAEAAAATNPRAQRWIPTSDGWEGPQGTQTNPTASSTKAAGITGFNTWWVLAPAANPLPIALLSFDVNCHDSSVLIEWATATELNNNFFTVEKTMDGKNFETVAIIPGAGNSNKILYYSIVDNSAFSNTTYYRLTQTDYDGKSESFKLVSVTPCERQTSWNLQAIQGENSTVRITLQSSVSEIIQFEIIDLLGNKITRRDIELYGGYQAEQLQVFNLIPGIYVGIAKTNDSAQTLKFIVKN